MQPSKISNRNNDSTNASKLEESTFILDQTQNSRLSENTPTPGRKNFVVNPNTKV